MKNQLLIDDLFIVINISYSKFDKTLMGAACSRLLRISPKLLHASEQSQYFEEG
jgi:hypothetical protein